MTCVFSGRRNRFLLSSVHEVINASYKPFTHNPVGGELVSIFLCLSLFLSQLICIQRKHLQ